MPLPRLSVPKDKAQAHLRVELIVTEEIDGQGTVTQTVTKRVSYSQNWQAYDHAQMQKRSASSKPFGQETPNKVFSFS